MNRLPLTSTRNAQYLRWITLEDHPYLFEALRMPVSRVVRTFYVVVCLALWSGVAVRAAKVQQPTAATAAVASAAPDRALLDRYCVTCHNGRLKIAGLELDKMDIGA